jgi:hypothetical protein
MPEHPIDPNSPSFLFGKVLTKLEKMDDKIMENHTEFMNRFNAHEQLDNNRHRDNSERLDKLEDSKKKLFYGVGGITAVGAFVHWFVDMFRPK